MPVRVSRRNGTWVCVRRLVVAAAISGIPISGQRPPFDKSQGSNEHEDQAMPGDEGFERHSVQPTTRSEIA